MTMSIEEGSAAPIASVIDQKTKIAITRLGDQIRVGGTADVINPTAPPDINRHDLLARTLSDLFVGSIAPTSRRWYWHAGRPMTPDSVPIIGATAVPGLFINAGHGTLGWTQAFASAQLVTDLILGKDPVVDFRDYSLSRYGARSPKIYSFRRHMDPNLASSFKKEP